MNPSRRNVRSVLLHCYRSGRNAGEAHRELIDSLGDDAPSRTTCYKWYERFDAGDDSLEDMPRSGRPLVHDRDVILQAVESSPKTSVSKLSEETGVPRESVRRILHESGKKPKRPSLIPHALTPAQLKKRADTCSSLLSRERNTAWTRFIVAQDEKWISYDNPDYSLEWCDADQLPEPVPKRPDHGNKEMLCFFFCSEGPVYWEILGQGETVDSTLFCKQLEEMEARVPQSHIRQGKITLLMDNARPHHAKITQQKLKDLNIDWIPHPPYSPDISPCDYHAFRSLEQFCRGKQFKNRKDLEDALQEWIDTRPPAFWRRGLENLADRWKTVVATNGKYYDDRCNA